MSPMMRAFVMKRIGEVGFAEKPVPEPGPNDAVIKTTCRALRPHLRRAYFCGAASERGKA